MSAFKLSRTLTILVIAGLAVRDDCASVNSSSSTGGSKTEISNNNDDFDETPNFLNNIYEAATAASARRHKSPESESRVVAIDVNGTFGGTEQARMAVDEAVVPVRPASRGESTGCGRFKKCNRGEAGDTRLNEVKKLILEKLNMERPPNITKPTLPLNSPPVQQLMKKYGINITDDDVDDYDDNDFGTIKRKDVISVAKTLPFNRSHVPGPCCYFQFSRNDMEFDVASADLWFYVRSTNFSSGRALVEIEKYEPPLFPNEAPQRFWMKTRPLTTHRDWSSWRKISITDLVRIWMKYPFKNHGINIFSVGIPGLIATDVTHPEQIPFLELDLVASRRRRKRSSRNNLVCQADSDESRCCRYDYEINFENIGWNWIIVPKRFNARHCAGECTSTLLSTTRAKFERHANLSPPGNSQPNNCCHAQEMVPISMIHYDEQQNIVYSNMPDLKINRCSCL